MLSDKCGGVKLQHLLQKRSKVEVKRHQIEIISY